MLRKGAFGVLLAVTTAAILFCHLYQLADVPRGIYLDEASIGYNAMTLVESGRDEHGELLPVYFAAMGEYKNPLYIYATAALFKVLGPSELHLRLTSALFFLAALALFVWLLIRLFPEEPAIWLYGLLALGFMPHYFNISRVSFEAISELPFLVGILVALHETFEWRSGMVQRPAAIITGLVLGLSVYSYSTNRLYSVLILATILFLYFRRDRFPALGRVIGSFAVALIPLAVFSFTHPGALTKRFDAISYVGDPRLSLPDKILEFVRLYFVYLGPDFLLLHGDGNLRHTSGLGGVIFWTVLGLAIVGLVAIAKKPELRRAPFVRLILILTLLAPVPAALTTDAHGHVLRSLPLSLFLLLISCYGFQATRQLPSRRGALVGAACLLLLAGEAGTLMVDYFTRYPPASVAAFESAGFPQLLKEAYAFHPREVRYADAAKVPKVYSYVEFYRRLLHLPAQPPLRPGARTAEAGTCAIYFHHAPELPPGVKVALAVEDDAYAVRLQCFQ